jgi:hypothetical protein
MAVAIHWGDEDDRAFAYRSGQVIAIGNAAITFAVGAEEGSDPEVHSLERAEGLEDAALVDGLDQPLQVVRRARLAGLRVQPNHVMYAHGHTGCSCCCGPHPALSSDPDYAHGLDPNPLRANPLRANPLRANPLRANPLRANPLRANVPIPNTAVPAEVEDGERIPFGGQAGERRDRISVWVLDTGLADKNGRTAADGSQLPPYCPEWLGANVSPSSTPDSPDAVANDQPDAQPRVPDRWLDPVAGHGTFIAGIIEQLTPGCQIESHQVVDPGGDCDEGALATLIETEVDAKRNDGIDLSHTIINLSLGGYLYDPRSLLAESIAFAQRNGAVVVASAGNDASCEPLYPAAFPGVISVGALGDAGPAGFTNYGEWVLTCAQGVDLVSAFFNGFDGAWGELTLEDVTGAVTEAVDPDHFKGLATWSGTSFAAPVVVSALIQRMDGGATAQKAAEDLLGDQSLETIPCLGKVVPAPGSQSNS